MMGGMRYRTAPEVVADYIRDAIHRNELRPGQQLQQEELAAKFGISRIPVRDALRQLQGEGLVDLYPNRGAFVANPGLEELREVFELRILLEVHALKIAVPQYTKEDLEICSSLQTQMESATTQSEYWRVDQEFHAALYSPSRQPRTLGLIENLRGVVNRYYFLYLRAGDCTEECRKEHRQILRACQKRDVTGAAVALEKHLRNALRDVEAAGVAAQKKEGRER